VVAVSLVRGGMLDAILQQFGEWRIL